MLSSVASTIRGASAQAMIVALAEGKTDPDELIRISRGFEGALWSKQAGRHFDPTHGFIVKEILGHPEHLDGMLNRLNEEINRQLRPYAEEVRLLQSIPGVKEKTTQVIVAELGVS